MGIERPKRSEHEAAAGRRMPASSRYAGELIDTSARRSIQIQAGGPIAISAEDTHVVVDYFYHEGEFWKAVVPLDGVDQILGQAFNFSKPKTRQGKDGAEIRYDRRGLPRRTVPLLNHVQSRFRLQPGEFIELFPLEGDNAGDPRHRIDDFIYSLEAVGPVGVGFGLRDAFAGNLISAHRFLSTREMVFERIAVENQYVTESPPLPLRDDQKRAVLVESLLRSHRAGMNERYYLYRCCGTNNCSSNPLQILDMVVEYPIARRLGAALYRLPLAPRFYLRVRGMDADPSVRKLVRHEFTDYIAAPETKQRRRDYVRRITRARRAARDERARRDSHGAAGG